MAQVDPTHVPDVVLYCPLDGSKVLPWDEDDPAEAPGVFGICQECSSIWEVVVEGEDEVFGHLLIRQIGFTPLEADAIRAIEQLGIDLDWCSLCGRKIEEGGEHDEHDLGGPLTPGPMRDAA